MYDSVPGWPAWVSQAVCAGEHIDAYDVDNIPATPTPAPNTPSWSATVVLCNASVRWMRCGTTPVA